MKFTRKTVFLSTLSKIKTLPSDILACSRLDSLESTSALSIGVVEYNVSFNKFNHMNAGHLVFIEPVFKGNIEGSLGWFNVHNVFAAFFEREFRASTIKSTVAIETTIKVLDHANILLDIATDDSFKEENEGGAVDSKANNNGTTNAVEAKVINDHAEQEAIYQMMLPYLELQITAKFEYI
ncbi:hypothetical protein MAM1_0075c04317 [Mucor ambiguus]|uniref:Uncharacterized protein n=1 Tax=Mucor ambiguus TaxID=91626 RepID=A0A0C9MNN5_9FUNG|nr:hypothetical protein MAM1_0075c04317 [Mucor ambiguus]